MRIQRRQAEDIPYEQPVHEARQRTGWSFPRRGLLQPGVPDGTWSYVWVTFAKGVIGAVIGAAIWPYVPAWEATLDGADRQLARGAWMMLFLFLVIAVWCTAKAIQGAWLALR